MVTEKMIEAAVNAVSENVDWVAALAGSSYGDATQVMRGARSAALSTDAEPVVEIAGQQGRYWIGLEGRWSNWFDITFNTWVPEPGVREVRNLYAAPPAPSVALKALDEDNAQIIRDAIRSAYDRGYNDARNAKSVPGDNALGYRGRDMSEEIAVDYLARLRRQTAALSAQVQDVAIPAGWKKIPERYSNYPWSVERYADGWHLNNHDFSATSRFVGVHATAAEAMAAAPAAKQGEAECSD